MSHPAPTVVVGVDGSKAAINAARWAVDEAISRDIALRLVYVVEPSQYSGAGIHETRVAAGRAALYDARRAVEFNEKPVKIETEIVTGKPLAKLVEESRSAALICVGAVGLNSAHRGVGSISAALAAAALCPVAVIGRPAARPRALKVARVVVQASDGAVLRHAFEEARLRRVPLLVVSVTPAGVPDDADEKRLAQAELDRRMARWVRSFPDVRVECVNVRGSVDRYLAANDEPDQLLVTDSLACFDVCGAHNAGRSVLAVRSKNL
ncbi:universal stress protein [Mycobacterium parmense]|uniref:Universal stress protein n=1 Tax=Mycobacterium parmense TaxID=185642 RepID=A0A7I7YX30_9MYCO|nr:universal stress protein [Mycobacterium parmense]MCV7351255.1 universal stress protein [Mycobacterium parmense]ORW60790.1 universal stress protein [Mycobacterium parmense]BBZ45291.1 universal stress protein [Mycobacterium parmense]